MHERVFAPLGLGTAGLGAPARLGRLDAAVGHRTGESGRLQPMPWGAAADIPPMLGPAGNAHMSVRDFARWAAWNAAEGDRPPALVAPDTVRFLHAPRVRTPPRDPPRPGTPEEGFYALGWGIIEFDWADRPLLVHNGSNGMNLAKILVDTEADLGIVALTNRAGQPAETALSAVVEHLYRTHGPAAAAGADP